MLLLHCNNGKRTTSFFFACSSLSIRDSSECLLVKDRRSIVGIELSIDNADLERTKLSTLSLNLSDDEFTEDEGRLSSNDGGGGEGGGDDDDARRSHELSSSSVLTRSTSFSLTLSRIDI